MVVNAVLQRALTIRARREQELLDYVSNRAAGLIGSNFSRVMRSAVRALLRRPWG